MKKIFFKAALLSFALFTMTTVFTACNDDDKEDTFSYKKQTIPQSEYMSAAEFCHLLENMMNANSINSVTEYCNTSSFTSYLKPIADESLPGEYSNYAKLNSLNDSCFIQVRIYDTVSEHSHGLNYIYQSKDNNRLMTIFDSWRNYLAKADNLDAFYGIIWSSNSSLEDSQKFETYDSFKNKLFETSFDNLSELSCMFSFETKAYRYTVVIGYAKDMCVNIYSHADVYSEN